MNSAIRATWCMDSYITPILNFITEFANIVTNTANEHPTFHSFLFYTGAVVTSEMASIIASYNDKYWTVVVWPSKELNL